MNPFIALRPARSGDADALCAVINPIIEAGGTTAHRNPFDRARMTAHYIAPDDGISCILAEEGGVVLGFQSLVRGTAYDLPEDWAVIATFVRPGAAQRGIGSRLFAATLEAARSAGIATIDATIRRENTGGLTYYGRLGFTDYRATAETISKRYDLHGRA